MNKPISNTNAWEARTKKNTKHLALWSIAWTLSVALATFGSKFIWHGDTLATILAILLNLGIGIGMIRANKRHLKGLDELQQKIQLEAMALALGVGLVGGLSYSLLDITNLIASDAEISHLIMLMALTYIAGIVAGQVKYK